MWDASCTDAGRARLGERKCQVGFIGVGDRASAAAHIAFLNRKGPALLMPHPGDQAAPLCSYASLMLL